MVPILIFESLFFLVEILYFMFADLLDIEMIAFYAFEIISLTIFIFLAILLLIFFLWRDPFLISEITLSIVLVLTDCIIIAIHAALRDKVHVFLYICVWFARALRVAVIYFRLEQYRFKINWLSYNWKILRMKRTRTPV